MTERNNLRNVGYTVLATLIAALLIYLADRVPAYGGLPERVQILEDTVSNRDDKFYKLRDDFEDYTIIQAVVVRSITDDMKEEKKFREEVRGDLRDIRTVLMMKKK